MHLIHVSWLAMTLKLTAVKEKSSAVFLSRDIFDPYMTFLIWPSIVAVAVPAALDDCFGHRQEYCFTYDFFSQKALETTFGSGKGLSSLSSMW